MPEDTSKRNRVVRTKDAAVAIAGYRLDSDGTQLFEAMVNAQSNEVTWRHTTKARYGIDFVEADEDTAPLRDATNKLIDQQREAGVEVISDRPIRPVDDIKLTDPADTDADGELSKAERKAWNKSHPDNPK